MKREELISVLKIMTRFIAWYVGFLAVRISMAIDMNEKTKLIEEIGDPSGVLIILIIGIRILKISSKE